jgi:hypothetical protein
MAGLLTDRRSDREQLPAGDRFLDAAWDAAYHRMRELESLFNSKIESWTAQIVSQRD